MDMGLGEEPEEPDEDEPPEEVPDKLRPKNPIYVDPVSVDNTRKYKEGYMFYRANEAKEERTLENRYLRIYHDKIRKQREDSNQIDIAH